MWRFFIFAYIHAMKRRYFFLLVVLLYAAVIVYAGVAFPKYAVRMGALVLMLLLDILFRHRFVEAFRSRSRLFNNILRFLYWLPIVATGVFLFGAAILPASVLPHPVMIYAPGLILLLLVGKVTQLVFILIATLLAFLSRLFLTEQKNARRISGRIFDILLLSGVSFSLLLSVLFVQGMIFGVYNFETREITLPVKQLPANFHNYRIVQISDIHLGSWYSMKPLEEAVHQINALHPDMVVFTGDLVNFRTDEAYPAKEILQSVSATDGVFAILGNHDYGDYSQWRNDEEKAADHWALENFYQAIGWTLLKNDHCIIRRKSDSLALIGVENWSKNKIWGRRGDIARAMQGCENFSSKILLSHDPTHWHAEVIPLHSDIFLTLSGHTHAMQMGWEMRNCRWSPSQWIFKEWAGLYESSLPGKPVQYLYVNRGLGFLGYPGRIGIKPEITIFILHSD